MAKFDIVMPKMGESVEEATITKWFVNEGDKIEEDDMLLEIATDKVDSEIPSPVAGKISKILFKVDDLVPVGSVIAVVDLEGDDATSDDMADNLETEPQAPAKDKQVDDEPRGDKKDLNLSGSSRFYSPLVKSIAEKENITREELDNIEGHGSGGRVKKQDVLKYLEQRGSKSAKKEGEIAESKTEKTPTPVKGKAPISVSAEDEIIEMDRLRTLIAENMIRSQQVSAHVTNMVETDVTNLVLWRNKVKNEFANREGEKLTYLPLILEATVRALKDFPKINAQVDGDKIIIKKKINLGVAVALPDDNLIVPVIKEAEQKNVVGITKSLNDLATRARANKLSPDDIQGGTFSISNFGTFRNVMGTPIINQPQVAILAIGTIEKKPAVVETETGDVIAIRHKMFLSLTYDHRIIDGALGGAFLRKLADYLEGFDVNRTL